MILTFLLSVDFLIGAQLAKEKHKLKHFAKYILSTQIESTCLPPNEVGRKKKEKKNAQKSSVKDGQTYSNI